MLEQKEYNSKEYNGLEIILSCNIDSELQAIDDILSESDVRQCLIDLLKEKNEVLSDKLLEIVNKSEYDNVNYIKSIRESIKTTILMYKLNMNVSFKDIYDQYHNFDKWSSMKQDFCNYLFEKKNGNNLEIILLYNDESELKAIDEMLRINNVRDCFIDVLNKNNSLSDKLLNIINKSKYDNVNCIKSIRDSIETTILMYKLNMRDNSFKDICNKYNGERISGREIIAQDFWNILCKNLGILLHCNIKSELNAINEMLDKEFVKECLVYLCLKYGEKYYGKILQIINEDNISNVINDDNNQNLSNIKINIKNKIKNCIKESTEILELPALCKKILGSEKINQNEDIDKFFEYLLGEKWVCEQYDNICHLELVLLLRDSNLSLILQTLQKHEVRKNLPIIRSKYIMSMESNDRILKKIINCETLNNGVKNDIETYGIMQYIKRYLNDKNFSSIMCSGIIYSESISILESVIIDRKMLNEMKSRLFYCYKEKNIKAKAIVDCLLNNSNQSEIDFGNDILFARKGYQMLNDLFKNNNGEFTFDNFKNIVKGKCNNDQINKINELLSRQLIQYYVSNEINDKDVKKYVEIIKKIGSETMLDDNNRGIFETVKQCFEKRYKKMEEATKQQEEIEKKKAENMKRNNNSNNMNIEEEGQ